MVSVIAHEVVETVSDPVGTGWYFSDGQENADFCAWKTGDVTYTASGQRKSMRLGARDFLIQVQQVLKYLCAQSFRNLSLN
jgi:hypothetical protein